MRPLVVGGLATISCFGAFCAAALAEQAPAAPDAVLNAIRQSRGAFHAPTEDELARAKSEAVAARDALAKELALLPNGESLGEELGLNDLAEQLGQARPDRSQSDLAELDDLQRTLQFNRASAKGPNYDRLRAALIRYLQFLRSSAGPRVVEEYGRRIEQLEGAWRAYMALAPAERVRPPELAQVHDAYAWLARHGQATAATDRVRDAVSYPNHVMIATEHFIDRAVARPPDQPVDQPITRDETQDGTRISVRGNVKGHTHATLEPDANHGAVRVHFHGDGVSKITARRGRVTVHARGDTRVESSEMVHLSDQGAAAHAPRVNIRHRTTPYAVCVDLRSRLLRKVVGKLACRAAWKQQPTSDRQAAARARRQVDEQMRARSAEFVRGANLTIEDLEVFSLLGPDPSEKLKVSTTPTHLRWSGEYASELQFAAPSAPPAVRPDAAAVVQIHESAINNTERLMAGRTTNEADFREMLFDQFGLVPTGDDQIAGRVAAELTLAEHEPITVHFDDEIARMTMRLSSVRDRREIFDAQPWTARAEYRAQVDARHLSIVRESLTIEPADAAGADRVRDILSRFLVAGASRVPTRPDASKLAKEFKLGDLTFKRGWLTIVLAPRKISE
ncbi:MAG TPA: hypothetical protein VMV69_19710 [Pirellulales bacterium]|nr:hypothetical protein [Pirellulales bacterium]